jgi:DNA-binding winged helix-turn-helix (wHTH) protein/tetratricopeptide (TPR) repeat protein
MPSLPPRWHFSGKIPAPRLSRAKAVSAQENPVHRFADCELDVRERRLLVHGQPVTLTPKVFDTLVLLVERAGHVVSKDELMAALWPRGFVHESNLTKHIWLIRRALGDDGDDARCIETVPKLGYRFVAPVQKVACAGAAIETAHELDNELSGSPRPASIAATPGGNAITTDHPWVAGRDADRRHGKRVSDGNAGGVVTPNGAFAIRRSGRLWLAAIGFALATLLAGLYWWRSPRVAPADAIAASDPGAMAIVDFSNLSGNTKDAWLGPALEQMLATEVAASGRLHAVPEELVRPARADLPIPEAGGYAPASLQTLQRRLGARYVLSGAYLVSGESDTPRLRVDLTVQDVQTGAAFATLSREGVVNDLPGLVAQMGGDLRVRFGERADPSILKQIAHAQPASAEVARHLGFALQALDQFDAARARDELLQAIAQAPGYAPAYLYLSQAWASLGYRAKAIAASKQAAQYAEGLPDEERLQIEAQQFAIQADYAKAADTLRKLVALRPLNPDYRLQRVGTLIADAKYADAVAVLAATRKLSAANEDPRIELAAADIEFARDRSAAAIPHTQLALRQAQRRGETGLVAEAELRLGTALDRDDLAESTLRAAAADFHRIGNPHGEAHALQNLGNLQATRNQIAAARETYQRAMTIYQGVGDLGGEAAIYDNLSDMLWKSGDRDGPVAALRQALAIARETGDPVRDAWTLTGLATVLADESASDEAAGMYRTAIALDRQAGARVHLAFALSAYADLLRVRGDLQPALDACAQAQDTERSLDASARTQAAAFECAQVALDHGDVDAAAASFVKIESGAAAAGDDFTVANAQLMLGQIAMGRNAWSDARIALRKSLSGWFAQQEKAGEATTQALLALCDAMLGDDAARDAAHARARELRAAINQRQEAIPLYISQAELAGIGGNPDQAMASLRSLTDEAVKRHWVGYALEARLAQVRMLERASNDAVAKTTRAALDADAHKAGFGWIAQRVAMLDPAPAH